MIRIYTGTTQIEGTDIEILVMFGMNDHPENHPHVATRLRYDTRWSAPLELEERQ